jgi:hypothetical protein
MKKRILVSLSVVALMVVMLAVRVAPAFAGWVTQPGPFEGCRTGDARAEEDFTPEGSSIDGKRSDYGEICVSRGWNGFKFYDNRPLTPP